MIVSCGEALVDLVPDPVPGGGPMNVAVAAARLGAQAAFIGCVSTDEHGNQIIEHLRSNNVDLSAIQMSPNRTARAIVEHVPELVFRFEGTDTADTMLGPVDLSVLTPGPHIIHGGTLGLFRGQTADTLAGLAERHDGLVSLDPNVRPQIIDDRARWDHYHNRWLANTDLYKASDEDLQWIWPDRDVAESVAQLHELGVSVVVVTKGSEGMAIHTTNGTAQVPAPATTVVDTVGAGDTTVAAILVGLTERAITTTEALVSLDVAGWTAVAANAAEAAAITCSRPGADPPYRADVSW